MYVVGPRRRANRGLGVLALGGAVLIPLFCLILATGSAGNAAAPAIVGGGGAMLGLLLGRWGYGEITAHSRR